MLPTSRPQLRTWSRLPRSSITPGPSRRSPSAARGRAAGLAGPEHRARPWPPGPRRRPRPRGGVGAPRSGWVLVLRLGALAGPDDDRPQFLDLVVPDELLADEVEVDLAVLGVEPDLAPPGQDDLAHLQLAQGLDELRPLGASRLLDRLGRDVDHVVGGDAEQPRQPAVALLVELPERRPPGERRGLGRRGRAVEAEDGAELPDAAQVLVVEGVVGAGADGSEVDPLRVDPHVEDRLLQYGNSLRPA